MKEKKISVYGVTVPACQNTFTPDLSLVSGVLSDDKEYTVFPGFCDVHVHFREPGFSYKEDMRTGSLSAARGGYTAVCTMPNLDPVPDSAETLETELCAIREKALIGVYPFGSITCGEKGEKLSDMAAMSNCVIGFSDDGKGVQDEDMMRSAMLEAKKLGKVISAHCEDNRLLFSGYIHAGEYAEAHGHKGILSESEWKPIERDIKLCAETGCAYHVCHISCRESVELIRNAKKSGVNITSETAPHYLIMDDSELQEDGRFKMNPPLRSRADREALLEGVLDGTVDMIATDHAPHSLEEKSRGLAKSSFGVVGLETAFSSLYTELVMKNIISLDRLLTLLCVNPRKRFGIPLGSGDYSVWELGKRYTVDPSEFLSKGRATPFEGREFYGRCKALVCGGKLVYADKE